MNKWNGKRFSIYDNEEKQMLGLVKNLGDQTNYNTDEVEKLTISNNKKVSHEEMKSKYKMDDNANFTGSWFGVKKPTQVGEGLATVVENIANVEIPKINEDIKQIEIDKASKEDMARLSSGTPLFVSSTTQMTDTTKNYVNTTDGYIYFYSSGSWQKSSLKYQEYGLSKTQVKGENLGENTLRLKYDLGLGSDFKKVDGSFISYQDGNLQANVNYFYYDGFISVTPGEKLYFTRDFHGAFYNNLGTFLVGHQGTLTNDNELFLTVPEGCYKLKVSSKLEYKSKFRVFRYSDFNKNSLKYVIPSILDDQEVIFEDKFIKKEFCDDTILSVSIGKNLFNYRNAIDKYFVDYKNGKLIANDNYITSEYIEIESLQNYSQPIQTHIALYDKDKKFTRGFWITDCPLTFQTNSNEKYIRISINKQTFIYTKYQFEKGTQSTSFEEFSYKAPTTCKDVNIIYPTTTEYNKYKNSRFYGKKVSWYGTSITQGYKWCQLVNQAFNFNATNNGVGGTAICRENNDSSMCTKNRMNGLYNGVYDENTGQTTYGGVAIPKDVEIIFVEGGTNDWARNWGIGDKLFTSSPNDQTFAGACHMMFKNLTELFPNAEIIFVGSPFGKMANRDIFTDKYGILNNQKLQTIDYGRIGLEIANKWGIKGINMGDHMQIHDNNVSTLIPDGLHLTTEQSQVKASNVIINYLLTQ